MAKPIPIEIQRNKIAIETYTSIWVYLPTKYYEHHISNGNNFFLKYEQKNVASLAVVRRNRRENIFPRQANARTDCWASLFHVRYNIS